MHCRIAGAAAFVQPLPSVSGKQILCLFLGGGGGHHFYMGKPALGVLYLLFFLTFIPALVALVECFLMPGRVEACSGQFRGRHQDPSVSHRGCGVS